MNNYKVGDRVYFTYRAKSSEVTITKIRVVRVLLVPVGYLYYLSNGEAVTPNWIKPIITVKA